MFNLELVMCLVYSSLVVDSTVLTRRGLIQQPASQMSQVQESQSALHTLCWLYIRSWSVHWSSSESPKAPLQSPEQPKPEPKSHLSSSTAHSSSSTSFLPASITWERNNDHTSVELSHHCISPMMATPFETRSNRLQKNQKLYHIINGSSNLYCAKITSLAGIIALFSPLYCPPVVSYQSYALA